MYPVFIVYVVADLLSGLALSSLVYISPHDGYTASVIASEILLTIGQMLVCREAARAMSKLRPFLPEVVAVVTLISAGVTTFLYHFMNIPQYYSSWLEPACMIKSVVDLSLSFVVVALLSVPRKWKILRTLEFKHAMMLAAYFAVNSMAYYAAARKYSIGEAPSELLMVLIPLVFFSAWIFAFRYQKPAEA